MVNRWFVLVLVFVLVFAESYLESNQLEQDIQEIVDDVNTLMLRVCKRFKKLPTQMCVNNDPNLQKTKEEDYPALPTKKPLPPPPPPKIIEAPVVNPIVAGSIVIVNNDPYHKGNSDYAIVLSEFNSHYLLASITSQMKIDYILIDNNDVDPYVANKIIFTQRTSFIKPLNLWTIDKKLFKPVEHLGKVKNERMIEISAFASRFFGNSNGRVIRDNTQKYFYIAALNGGDALLFPLKVNSNGPVDPGEELRHGTFRVQIGNQPTKMFTLNLLIPIKEENFVLGQRIVYTTLLQEKISNLYGYIKSKYFLLGGAYAQQQAQAPAAQAPAPARQVPVADQQDVKANQ